MKAGSTAIATPSSPSPGAAKPAANAQTGLPFTTADLGFAPLDDGWSKTIKERAVRFRALRALPELFAVESLQREVFGVTDHDLAAASQLVVVQETGGDVLGAFIQGGEDETHEELVGFAIGWGGYVDGRPRLVSDMLGVRVDMRRTGLGAELKKLQAATALARGFRDAVWTVDPLRSINARLNFEKLGAVADRYEENRYGAGYAASLYGGLPTDRLHVTWPLTSPRVRDRLLGGTRPLTLADIAGLAHFDPSSPAERCLVYLPADIDCLLAVDPNAALRWRLTLRETLSLAFRRGYVITGFVAEVDEEEQYAAYVIERTAASQQPTDERRQRGEPAGGPAPGAEPGVNGSPDQR